VSLSNVVVHLSDGSVYRVKGGETFSEPSTGDAPQSVFVIVYSATGAKLAAFDPTEVHAIGFESALELVDDDAD
jgi:hypothetical protein